MFTYSLLLEIYPPWIVVCLLEEFVMVMEG